jgi:hypothetical protein
MAPPTVITTNKRTRLSARWLLRQCHAAIPVLSHTSQVADMCDGLGPALLDTGDGAIGARLAATDAAAALAHDRLAVVPGAAVRPQTKQQRGKSCH